MPCPTSLRQEFGQYRTQLTALAHRLGGLLPTARPDGGALQSALDEVRLALTALEQFDPTTASSHSVLLMAERADAILTRVSGYCNQLRPV